MKRFYSYRELEGAIVVNLAGEYLGVFGGMRITHMAHSPEEAVEVRVVRHRAVRNEYTDIEGLRAEIEARFNGTFRKRAAEHAVREVLGLPKDSPISHGHYIEAAKRLGIATPLKGDASYVEEAWRSYPVSRVACICGPIQGPHAPITVMVIREKEPQARPLPPADPSTLRGGKLFPDMQKLVVDVANCDVLGLAVEIVIGGGEVGLRVSRPPVLRRYINIGRLRKDLASTEFAGVVESLWRALGDEADVGDMDKVEAIVRSKVRGRSANDVLRLIHEAYIDTKTETEEAIRDVPWSRVLSIGDVVVLL